MSIILSPWEQLDWLEQAHDWILSELARKGIKVSGEIEQAHIRPWSTVMRVATKDGFYFFKATAPYFGYETTLTEYLARTQPLLVPQLLAHDLNRHWLLMRDSGIPLRTFIRAEKSIDPWRKVLPLYVELQKHLAGQVTDLLGLGVMDRRLKYLSGQFVELLKDESALLLDQPSGLTSAEFSRIRSLIPQFQQICAHLADFGIPESLHHDDFHDGNIFLHDNQVIFTDWGECAIAHPFFTLVVMLRSVENSLDLPPNASEIQTMRDWYLALWEDYAPILKLRELAELAECIGYVNRALTWHMVISTLPESLKPEYALAVPAYLKDYLNAVDRK
ncbi:MAG: phosphotransferase [Chloroflexi bacterium]|nr:phosphotransferase [Chloroflexota bacterium]